MKANYAHYQLDFKRPSGTSRGVLKQKDTFFIVLNKDGKYGVGECGLLRGLSIDDRSDYTDMLAWTCKNISLGEEVLLKKLKEFPSIQFGVETAFKSLSAASPFKLFPSEFTRGKDAIAINGLVWMGDKQFMKDQISEKLKEGFQCIKMKIGAIDFETELELLKSVRKEFSASEITLRVDANGAFEYAETLEKLKRLSDLEIHSIEQPIKQKQWEQMAELCAKTPLPIALDEELIGVFEEEDRDRLLTTIKPQYIILKPSLIGGMSSSNHWIELAEKQQVGWWMTSALESNIGLNAIAQYTYTKNNKMPQGLGTGSLYTNNIDSPLEVVQGALRYNTKGQWDWEAGDFLN